MKKKRSFILFLILHVYGLQAMEGSSTPRILTLSQTVQDETLRLLFKHIPLKLKANLRASGEDPNSARFSDDSSKVLIQSFDGAKIWELPSFECHISFKFWRGDNWPQFNHKGDLVFFLNPQDQANLLDTRSGKKRCSFENSDLASKIPDRFLWSDDDSLIILLCKNHATVISAQNGAILFSASDDQNVLALSSDGQRAFLKTADLTGAMVTLKDGQRVCNITGHRAPLVFALFSPGGEKILVGLQDKSIKLLHAATGELLGQQKKLQRQINTALFSRCGNRILIEMKDNHYILCDGDTFKKLDELAVPASDSFVICPDGERLYEIPKTGAQAPLAHQENPTGLVFAATRGELMISPDAKLFVCNAGLFNAQTGEKLATSSWIYPKQFVFSLDGAWLLCITQSDGAKLFHLTPTNPKGLHREHLDYLVALDRYVDKRGNEQPNYEDFLRILSEQLISHSDDEIKKHEAEIFAGFTPHQQKALRPLVGRP